jgi:hypothetical protein
MATLDDFGLPSKGDCRLLNFETQESYFNKIVHRYMQFCAASSSEDELAKSFASLSVSRASSVGQHRADDGPSEQELSTILLAMRKLREGIVASQRIDDFAIRAYVYSIQVAILTKHMESYHPALLYLLRNIHPVYPLSEPELQEFVGYLILDLACRQQNFAQAYAMRSRYKFKDRKVLMVLDAMVHDNFHVFWKLKRSVDGYKARLMEYGEDIMRVQALKCLGRTYMSVDLPYLQQATDSDWVSLKSKNAVGWDLDGGTVIIRKPKAR